MTAPPFRERKSLAAAGAEREDIAGYECAPTMAEGLAVYIVVKSLDQIARRKRLIESKRRGLIGRISPRPVSEGLLVKATVDSANRIDAGCAEMLRAFREPRGLAAISEDRFLLTEIDRILLIDSRGEPLRDYHHPYFSFLHSVSVDRDKRTFLVVSSGYDAVFEIDLENGATLWEWFGWDHGFNPGDDGVFLTHRTSDRDMLAAQGLNVRYVDPACSGEQGLATGVRTTHPSSACYNPYAPGAVLVALGRLGQVIEITQATSEHRLRIDGLDQLPHAILPHGGGWIVTNTLAGELWLLDRDFVVRRIVNLAGLPGKPEEMREHEWLQAVLPLGGDRFVGIDGNRGLVFFDLRERCYAIQRCDENWSIQDLLPLVKSAV